MEFPEGPAVVCWYSFDQASPLVLVMLAELLRHELLALAPTKPLDGAGSFLVVLAMGSSFGGGYDIRPGAKTSPFQALRCEVCLRVCYQNHGHHLCLMVSCGASTLAL